MQVKRRNPHWGCRSSGGKSAREYSWPFGPQVAIDDISIVASDFLNVFNRAVFF